jgi:hypothetical protein
MIQVDSQLQSDSGDEASALRVMIYKIDNTTFGDDIPTLPQWIGPPSHLVCCHTGATETRRCLPPTHPIVVVAVPFGLITTIACWMELYESFKTGG